jgi:superfamily I DNA/RNA helicase
MQAFLRINAPLSSRKQCKMDAVELARQRASELHAAAVAAGENPQQLYAFAVAEASRRGIDVEPTSPGATLLNGGKATFVASDALILHENSGTPFEQAFLVAHEIGHVECGDDEANEAPPAIDPVRAAEPSPIGLDRVVDYGRRQRREVQMDLFAREFLLPRPVVRRLYLNERLTAAAIAERFGAPVEVVSQQLLDALFLPAISTPAAGVRSDRPPNPSQRDAAAHRGPAYLLEAGPGTGKTQTLTARVTGLLSDGVDPRRILVLTFSNKAAGEMTERIARHHKEAAAAMWIGTFHAFGLDVVRRFHVELGLPKDPRMLDRTEAVELLEREFPRLGLVHYRDLYDPTQVIADILAAISRAKDEVTDERRYAELAEQMRQNATTEEERIAAEKAAEVARVYAVYEALKRQVHCVDFGDLVSLPVRLLEADPLVRAHFREKYDHVLVDEYQDVNRSSVRLLAALRETGENLWVVGDIRQSIYRFRGASSYNLARFGREDFPGGMRGRLDRNYRSVEEVVGTFSSFAGRMNTGHSDGSLAADRGAGGHLPELQTVERAEMQPVAIADAIEAMRQAGHRYGEQAVLCTGNETLSNLGQALERLGVPVLFLGSLFERPEIKDMFSLLSLLVDGRAMGLVRLACWPEFAMPMPDVAAVLDYLRSTEATTTGWWRHPVQTLQLSAEGQRAVTQLGDALAGFNSEANPWMVLVTVLLDRTRIAERIALSSAVADQARGIALWQFLNFVRVQPAGAGLPIRRLLDRVRRLLRLGDDRDLRHLPAAAQGLNAVRLMTIHGAKGLEFPVVHLPGLNAGTLPRAAVPPACPPPDGLIAGVTGSGREAFRTAHAAEQECLFYVALSRAKDRLFLYAPTKNAANARRQLSPFIEHLGTGLARRHVMPQRFLPPSADAGEVPLLIDGGLQFNAHQVALYESCPRRFLYTHILQVGGRRTATGFTQMHDAIRTVFAELVISGVTEGEGTLAAKITAAFARHNLAGHGYEADYRAFALSMLRYFISIREGHTPEGPEALRLKFGAEEIIVLPDDVLVGADGVRTLRRVSTGRKKSGEAKDVSAAAFVLAAREAFPGAVVELVSLTDQAAEAVVMSPTELQNRREKLRGFLQEIRLGRFPADPSARTCPNCPAFFICGPTPAGILRKKF